MVVVDRCEVGDVDEADTSRDAEAMGFDFACEPRDRRGVRERVRAQLAGKDMCPEAGEVEMVMVGDEVTG